VKGYKGFGKGLICNPRGTPKQYAENTIFEEPKANICQNGMHFCENPLDVLDYYPLIDDNGDLTEFCEVEALGETKTDDNKKFCTTKLRVGTKISFQTFVRTSIDFIFSRTEAQSGNSSKSAQSGNSSKSAQSGDFSKSAQSGDFSKSAQSGYSSKIIVTGNNCVAANIGHGGKIKGIIGTWITLAEYDNKGICICVRSKKIDGKTLKADTFYMLKDKKFVEVK